MKQRIFQKGCMYGNHMNPVVECVSARVRPKKDNQENSNGFKAFSVCSNSIFLVDLKTKSTSVS